MTAGGSRCQAAQHRSRRNRRSNGEGWLRCRGGARRLLQRLDRLIQRAGVDLPRRAQPPLQPIRQLIRVARAIKQATSAARPYRDKPLCRWTDETLRHAYAAQELGLRGIARLLASRRAEAGEDPLALGAQLRRFTAPPINCERLRLHRLFGGYSLGSYPIRWPRTPTGQLRSGLLYIFAPPTAIRGEQSWLFCSAARRARIKRSPGVAQQEPRAAARPRAPGSVRRAAA